MAIRTRLQTRFVVQRVAMTAICVVFGLWGLYDYYYAIPAQQAAYDRGQVYAAVYDAMQAAGTGDPAAAESIAAATTRVREELNAVVERSTRLLEAEGETVSGEKLTEALRATDDDQWFNELAHFNLALDELRSAAPGSERSPQFATVYDGLKARLGETGEISPPARWDHVFQWTFILCLPCAPWFLWTLMRKRREVYELDDDGTLRAPGLAWKDEEIAEIDMSRWMSKSIVTIVHADGTRLALDDYVHRDVHRIAGAIASARHPEAWTAEARPVKKEEAPEAEETPVDDHDAPTADIPRPEETRSA